MTSFFQTVRDEDAAPSVLRTLNPWTAALGVLAAVLLVGGLITTAVGLHVIGTFDGTVLGDDQRFDEAVATAIVGGVAILLSVLVCASWLLLGAIGWGRRH